jgi:hypothetical protein
VCRSGSEVHYVEGVGKLAAGLEADSLADAEIAEYADVHILVTGAGPATSRGVHPDEIFHNMK